MVAISEVDTQQRVSIRLLRMMREAGLPGDLGDHEWMGRQIEEAAEKLADRFSREYGQDLILSGLAAELGLDLSGVQDLEQRIFPEPWLRSVPFLLQCGFPKASWRLIECGVLSCETDAVDARYAWRLDITRLSSLMENSYELGENLLLRLLDEGVTGITHERGRDSRIRIIAPSVSEGRAWRKQLERRLRKQRVRDLPLLTVGFS